MAILAGVASGVLLLVNAGCATNSPHEPAKDEPKPASTGSMSAKTVSQNTQDVAPAASGALISPTLEELPNLKPLVERQVSARIGVEGDEFQARRRIVADYTEPALTEEEKKAVGEDKPAVDDVLGFYRASQGTEHGAAPFARESGIGISGKGGTNVGYNPPKTGASSLGWGGNYARVDVVSRKSISIYDVRQRTYSIGKPWSMQIGEGPARSKAVAEERYNP
ncbi:MAG: hypothetical protein HZB38_17630 [Planctomycetes bacterium]|nr:hypothetical protein [Planctomycetota bacterium]